jgi:hypothetical protein
MAESLETIHRVVVRAEEQGLTELTAAMDKYGVAADNAGVATERTEKNAERADRQFLNLQKRIDPVTADAIKLGQAIRVIDQAFAQGVIGIEEYNTATDRALASTREAQQKAADAARAHAEAERLGEQAARAATREIQREAAVLNEMRQRLDPVGAALSRSAKEQDLLNKALASGAIRQKEHAALMAASQKNAEGAAKGIGLTTSAVGNLGYQLNDVVSGLAMGQSPFTIMTQQGGQVYQALNGPKGVGQGLRDAGTLLVNMITPARAAGAAIAAAAVVAYVAWSRFDDQQRTILGTLQGVGRGIGLTADQFREMAARAAEAGKISVASATEIANAFIRTGNGINPETVERLTVATKTWAATFTAGDVQGAVKDIQAMLEGGAQAVLDMGNKHRLFNNAQQEALEQAVRLNDINKAIAILMDALRGKTASVEETTSKAATAWDNIKKSISDIVQALGPLIDKMLSLAASSLGAAAQGIQNIMGGQVTEKYAPKGRDYSGLATAAGGGEPSPVAVPLPPPRPTFSGGVEKDIANTKEATAANKDLTAALAARAAAMAAGDKSTTDASSKIEQQSADLITLEKSLKSAATAGGYSTLEQRGLEAQLTKVHEAQKSADESTRDLALSFGKLPLAEAAAQAAKAAAETNGLAKAARDHTKELVPEDEEMRRRIDTQTQFNDLQKAGVPLTEAQKEASDANNRAIATGTDATGRRLRVDEILMQQGKAPTAANPGENARRGRGRRLKQRPRAEHRQDRHGRNRPGASPYFLPAGDRGLDQERERPERLSA